MMRKISIIILDILFCVGIALADFGLKSVIDSREINVSESPSITEVYSKADSTLPIYEDFDSINVPGRWSNVTGQTTMCSHFGSICYNCYSSAYNINDVYLYQSPNYGTQFNNEGCDSIEVEFNFLYYLRPNDSLYLTYKNYSTNTIKYLPVLDTNFNLSTFTSYVSVKLESEVEWLGFQLQTTDSGSGLPTNANYVHIQDISIDCDYVYFLDVGLMDFECNTYDDYIDVKVTTTEHSTLQLEHSVNGYEWDSICEVFQQELIYQHETYSQDNYYRVKYDGIISNTIHCRNNNTNYIIKERRYFNILGQQVDRTNGYYIESIEYENGVIKNKIKIKK